MDLVQAELETLLPEAGESDTGCLIEDLGANVLPCLPSSLQARSDIPDSSHAFQKQETPRVHPNCGVLCRFRVLFQTTPCPISRNERFDGLFNGLHLACIQPGKADFKSPSLRIEIDPPGPAALPFDRNRLWPRGVV